ncbi:MAG: NADH-quinone oxidoreductase subunit NuoH [Candidatus Symbiothrix sp.]|jgi:NADH-quinone oxidoreductase subunit H|nr:NADH-quinone oxidoreductase subunit NuoH [Candidatus Symbiothrix sp.]
MFHFEVVTQWIDEFLRTYLTDVWALLIEYVLIGVVILGVYAVLALVLIWLERKICAFFQCRLGPTRVGPLGLLQSVADMVKILLKELIKIDRVDPFLFRLAAFMVIIASICTFGAIPFDKGLLVIDFNIGVFYLLAVSSLGVVGILMAGWASNNKYTMIGAMRSGAQLISYELSCGLAMMTIVMLSGSLQLSEIVEQQAYAWNLWRGGIPAIIAFVIYLIAGHAETNRGPFDLPEAESELTAGYHTEYSGIQFGFFYLAEYLNMFIIAAIATTLFLGGWQPLYIPGWDAFNSTMAFIPPVMWFFAKAFACVLLSLWVRWTMPRLRIDQLLNLEWKILMPLALINILLMALWVIYL